MDERESLEALEAIDRLAMGAFGSLGKWQRDDLAEKLLDELRYISGVARRALGLDEPDED